LQINVGPLLCFFKSVLSSHGQRNRMACSAAKWRCPMPLLPPPAGSHWSAPLHRRPAAPPSHLPLRADTSPQRSSAMPNATSAPCAARRLLPLTLPTMIEIQYKLLFAYDDRNPSYTADNTGSSDKNDASMNYHLTDAPINLAFIPLNT
jgi:hypothetical protein